MTKEDILLILHEDRFRFHLEIDGKIRTKGGRRRQCPIEYANYVRTGFYMGFMTASWDMELSAEDRKVIVCAADNYDLDKPEVADFRAKMLEALSLT